MKKVFVLCCLVALFVALMPANTAAQTQQPEAKKMGPPPLVVLGREEVKPGKSAAHEKLETMWAQAYAKANWPNHYLAMNPIAGGNEVWFLSAFENFEAIENDDAMQRANAALSSEVERYAAQEDQYLANTRRWILQYREDLSYRPNTNIGEYHNMMVDLVRVKPGHGPKFGDLRKVVNAAHEKANLDEHMVIYQVIAGGPVGTFVVMQPLKGVKAMDPMGKSHGDGSDYYKALGDEGRQQTVSFMTDDVMNYERLLFALSPSMSYLSKETIAADPAFWSPKPMKAAKPVEAKLTKPKQ